MRFSIIVPTHNAENTIRKALNSIRSQTFKDYELIVVCDNCTDNTDAIAEAYTNKVYHVSNGCDGPTRNAGLEKAQGEYVLFMDDDDWWLHEYVLWQLNEKLKETGNPDVLCFSFIFKGLKYATPTNNYGINNNRWYAVWSKCWRREFIGNSRFSNVKMTSDVDFHNSVFAKHPRVVDWDMPMYYYDYMRKGSQTEIDRRR